MIAAVVIVGMIMSILDTTIVNVALDTLARDLGASLSTIQWVSSGYLLSLALVIPLSGIGSENEALPVGTEQRMVDFTELCQSCGHIGCCDSSPNRHASAHARASGHPVVRSAEPGEDWSWWYIDEVAFEVRG